MNRTQKDVAAPSREEALAAILKGDAQLLGVTQENNDHWYAYHGHVYQAIATSTGKQRAVWVGTVRAVRRLYDAGRIMRGQSTTLQFPNGEDE